MTQSAPSQSQPSYFTSTSLPLNKSKILSVEILANKMNTVEGQQFQDCLQQLSSLIKQGYATTFIKYTTTLRKIMNYFTKLSKTLENQSNNLSDQYKMIYVLSFVAELIKENPKFYFPFTRKFLSNVFLIDQNCLVSSPHRRNIVAILGVIYENLSKQSKLIIKYDIVDKLKQTILATYSLIDEIYTLKLFNCTIMNLVHMGVIFTTKQFQDYKILDTVSNFISKTEIDWMLFHSKLQSAMQQMNQKRKEQPKGFTLVQ